MKKICFFLSLVSLILFTFFVTQALAAKGVIATNEDILRLKRDINDGKLLIGVTRLNEVREKYGESDSIDDTDKKITYDYGDLKISFDKIRYWKEWGYDSFKIPVYTDEIDDLRYALETRQLVGNNITYDKILKDYDDPSEIVETNEDGKLSTYFYGNIRMVFENTFIVKTWKVSNLSEIKEEGLLSSSLSVAPTPIEPQVESTRPVKAAQ